MEAVVDEGAVASVVVAVVQAADEEVVVSVAEEEVALGDEEAAEVSGKNDKFNPDEGSCFTDQSYFAVAAVEVAEVVEAAVTNGGKTSTTLLRFNRLLYHLR